MANCNAYIEVLCLFIGENLSEERFSPQITISVKYVLQLLSELLRICEKSDFYPPKLYKMGLTFCAYVV